MKWPFEYRPATVILSVLIYIAIAVLVLSLTFVAAYLIGRGFTLGMSNALGW
jgi:hypothetical protein